MDGIFRFGQSGLVAAALALGLAASCGGQVPGGADGGRTQFEVASVRPDDPNAKLRTVTNVDLDSSGLFRYEGGPVVMDGYLVNYLIFAYKLRDRGEYRSLNARLPKWGQFSGESFTIQARAGEHPSKDDLRAMVRTLLAERFGLEVHTETQPQLAWVLVQTAAGARGKTSLRPHTGPPLCTTMTPEDWKRIVKERKPDELYPYCGTLLHTDSEGAHVTIQDLTMPEIAGELGLVSGNRDGLDDLPQVDGTGLQGRYDLDFHYARRPRSVAVGDAPASPQGPDMLEALSSEGGLQFRKKTVPVELLIVDKVHEPAAD